MAGDEPPFLIVGTVQKPHGIKGELFVRLDTDRPGAAFAPGRVLRLGTADGNPLESGVLTIERARPFKGGMLVKALEFTGRSPAQDEIRGRALLVPRGEAQALEEGEVFYHQLLGMRVMTEAEGEVGVVTDLYEAPSGPLLAVRRAERGELLIPFVQQMIRRIDAAEGVLELDLPAGLLEL
ncbi:ribosome maturation factor RimM [Longimicrobium terrae]|uniref:Ribosome maturation factor RimM n=1 Tax=Longimicrobium terrae TaxID=1639882 RepID=A0A841H6H3_9BACT|nr:ribosome maturation factor RimM [Longimicrobium terrae]MBB4639294.1 16S rRNA processing protein RimM [Longimicrobium terrae]MBB6073534.1 16S rRNA processing protein RimM [Longimicrobium terrae]NNC32218.1 16S rRNA processing protein RimM [Longimicrobium terrae]